MTGSPPKAGVTKLVTGTYESLVTGVVADKTEVLLVRCQPAGALTAAGAARFWVYDGATAVCVGEWVYAGAYTPVYADGRGLLLPIVTFNPPVPLPTTSHVLRGSTYNGDDIKVVAESKRYA